MQSIVCSVTKWSKLKYLCTTVAAGAFRCSSPFSSAHNFWLQWKGSWWVRGSRTRVGRTSSHHHHWAYDLVRVCKTPYWRSEFCCTNMAGNDPYVCIGGWNAPVAQLAEHVLHYRGCVLCTFCSKPTCGPLLQCHFHFLTLFPVIL